MQITIKILPSLLHLFAFSRVVYFLTLTLWHFIFLFFFAPLCIYVSHCVTSYDGMRRRMLKRNENENNQKKCHRVSNWMNAIITNLLDCDKNELFITNWSFLTYFISYLMFSGWASLESMNAKMWERIWVIIIIGNWYMWYWAECLFSGNYFIPKWNTFTWKYYKWTFIGFMGSFYYFLIISSWVFERNF